VNEWQRRLIEIMTAYSNGDEALERQLVEELLADPDPNALPGVFGSTLRLAMDLIDALADMKGLTRTALVHWLALRLAAKDQ
jgi:hypothetical protein